MAHNNCVREAAISDRNLSNEGEHLGRIGDWHSLVQLPILAAALVDEIVGDSEAIQIPDIEVSDVAPNEDYFLNTASFSAIVNAAQCLF